MNADSIVRCWELQIVWGHLVVGATAVGYNSETDDASVNPAQGHIEGLTRWTFQLNQNN